ncbi:uncharacterized protein FTOL_05463 [Fusarium torulosum]|uniref:LysM domain-containing protein n=1 Tax=Fusarium torulosum TaxID=33205 RepID=A0AAE8M809_9HYPO|nr:uncharacterized protein FTOL_05463 [Fusarium torulosum]
MDIRLTNPTAYVYAIHWQVAQATSLENIKFYILYNSEVPSNTQQGIYMENGSGGFMADLTFVGGNFGAYFGNQQFTTSHLVFVNCNTAVQVHWDWAWTIHDYVIESCGSEDNSLDCGTDEWYTTSTGETCDSIGLKRGVSSASLFIVNQYRLPNCSADAVIEPGTKLCMPAKCDRVHQLRTEEDCHLLESNATNKLLEGDVQLYNPWNNTSSNSTDTTTPQPFNPYTYDKIAPPTGAKVPQGTTERCGRWYVAGKEDSCAHICAVSSIDIDLLFMVNTGLGTDAAACSAKLVAGNAYCVGPNHDWKDPYPQRTSVSTTIYITDGYVWPAETGE